MDLWSKDYLWKGYTIFELKSSLAENGDSCGVSSGQVDQQSVHADGNTSEQLYDGGGSNQDPPWRRFGPTTYLQDPTSLTVTVNVNVAGGATSSSSNPPQRQASKSSSSVDSEFEMVEED